MINLEDLIINSGHRSGENIPNMTRVFNPSEEKGTDQLYNVRVDRVDGPITKDTILSMHPNAGSSNVIGARKSFNTGSSNVIGARKSFNAGSSNVIGARKSFNAGSSNVIGTRESFNAGEETNLHMFISKRIPREFPGNSFYNQILDFPPRNTSVDCEDRSHRQHGNAGTQFSFNVLGGGSSIDMKDATINSGYCSGVHNDPRTYCHKDVSDCKGTDESFNATRGGRILLEGAHVCSGGYAGNHIPKGAPGSSAAKNNRK